jgi:hypothetical protein
MTEKTEKETKTDNAVPLEKTSNHELEAKTDNAEPSKKV